MSERRVPRTRTINRDLITWLIGVGLMIYQGTLPVAEFNLAVFLGGMALSGTPMALNGFALITGRTALPPSPSPAEPSPPESSLPSSGA